MCTVRELLPWIPFPVLPTPIRINDDRDARQSGLRESSLHFFSMYKPHHFSNEYPSIIIALSPSKSRFAFWARGQHCNSSSREGEGAALTIYIPPSTYPRATKLKEPQPDMKVVEPSIFQSVSMLFLPDSSSLRYSSMVDVAIVPIDGVYWQGIVLKGRRDCRLQRKVKALQELNLDYFSTLDSENQREISPELQA